MIIYLIENKLNGKKYVGQTVRDLDRRLYEHIFFDHSVIHRAIDKYGWQNFEVSVIEECSSQEELNEREVYYIKKFGCMTPNGYNVVAGGNSTSGYKHTDEHKQKLRELNSGVNNPRYGSPCSVKSKLESSRKNSRPVKDLTTGVEYPSMSSAANAVGGKIAMISACANGSIKSAYGHVFVRI